MATEPRSPLDLLVVGHLNIDAEVQVPELPTRDRTVPVVARRESLGGTAANIARWSRRLGLRVALSSFVGPDVPSRFLGLLRKEGVGISDVVVRRGEFSPVCWIFEDGRGGQLTIIDQGSMRKTGHLPIPRGAVRRARLVHVTTGDPEFQLAVARSARGEGRLVAFDPAQEVHYRWSAPDLRRLLGLSEIFFGNEHESTRAATLAGVGTPARLVEKVPLVVVTRGPKGARAYTRRGKVEVPSPKVRNLHRVTGAGDAFRAGFYRGWFSGEPLERCLAWGTAAGATAVSTPPSANGALPPLAAVERFLPSERSAGGSSR